MAIRMRRGLSRPDSDSKTRLPEAGLFAAQVATIEFDGLGTVLLADPARGVGFGRWIMVPSVIITRAGATVRGGMAE